MIRCVLCTHCTGLNSSRAFASCLANYVVLVPGDCHISPTKSFFLYFSSGVYKVVWLLISPPPLVFDFLPRPVEELFDFLPDRV